MASLGALDCWTLAVSRLEIEERRPWPWLWLATLFRRAPCVTLFLRGCTMMVDTSSLHLRVARGRTAAASASALTSGSVMLSGSHSSFQSVRQKVPICLRYTTANVRMPMNTTVNTSARTSAKTRGSEMSSCASASVSHEE